MTLQVAKNALQRRTLEQPMNILMHLWQRSRYHSQETMRPVSGKTHLQNDILMSFTLK
jgi:hypothetical protein